MNLWKLGIPKVPNINLQSVRDDLTKAIWREEPIPQELDLFELNKFLVGKRKIKFESVSSHIDEFVEIYVPLQVDKIYSVCSLIEKLRHLNNEEELMMKYKEASEVIQGLKQYLLEIDNLENQICDEDIDDFDLRVKPAKEKLKNATTHLLETTGHNTVTDCGACIRTDQVFAPIRSPKARDLLSFLNGNETNDSNFQETSFNEQQLQVAVKEELPEIREINDENLTTITLASDQTDCEKLLENLNHELLELQELMSEFHQFVHLQGEMVDEISDNVDCAEENVTQGNVQLKKANILKAALFPILGAVIGGAVAGPIGLVAGAKVGSVTGGLAMAGVTGSVVGYQGGKLLKKRQQEQIELNNLTESDR